MGDSDHERRAARHGLGLLPASRLGTVPRSRPSKPREAPCPAPCERSSSSTAYVRHTARPATRASTPRPAPTTSSSGCIRELLRRHPDLPKERVEEVAIAATTQIGDQGPDPRRVAALLSGLPNTTPGYSIDRMCAGAMTAVTAVAGAIAMGAIDVGIAGGVEHMGRHPMGEGVDPNPRILSERLVDPSALVMGQTAENLHDRYPSLTKERCDAYAVGSPGQRPPPPTPPARSSRTSSRSPPVTGTPGGAWPASTSRRVRAPPSRTSARSDTLPPARAGQPGNAAGLNDGATACLLAAEQTAAELGLPVGMRLVSYAFVGVEPEVMGIGPVPATEKALAKAGLTIEDIGLFELNEAFAVQVLAMLEHFGIADDDPRVNMWGGAIAVGHPLASSGVRLMTQLSRQFAERPDVRYGLTAMCIGIGMGGCVIWENPHHADYQPSTKDVA